MNIAYQLKKNMIKKIKLDNNSFFIGENFSVGENFSIGNNNIIRARNFECGDNVNIGSNNDFLIGKSIVIGDCSYIGNNNNIVAINANFGDYLYLDSNVIIGHGGKMNYDSNIKIGYKSMICSYVKLNTNYSIEIGNNVGIGEYVDVWTHGSFPPVLQGYPSQFGKVSIGSNVWLPAKSTVMPGVVIGDNIVIGANSIINKNLPSGSLCAGMPVKILKENIYPIKLSNEQKNKLISESLSEYEKLKSFKEINFDYFYNSEHLILKSKKSTFDFNDMSVNGELTVEDEDLRDFLRRRGLKFFTGKPFKSIIPPMYNDLINEK